jgi:hypothetical protein
VLASQDVGRGDPVVIYLPMVPEAAIAMLSCAERSDSLDRDRGFQSLSRIVSRCDGRRLDRAQTSSNVPCGIAHGCWFASYACSSPASTRHRSTSPPRRERRLGAAFASSRCSPKRIVTSAAAGRALCHVRERGGRLPRAHAFAWKHAPAPHARRSRTPSRTPLLLSQKASVRTCPPLTVCSLVPSPNCERTGRRRRGL